MQSEKLEEPMRLQINIENSTRRAGYQFKCHVFVSGAWSAAPCNTTSLSVAPDSSVSANCDCSVSKNIYDDDLKIFEPHNPRSLATSRCSSPSAARRSCRCRARRWRPSRQP